MSDKSDFLKAEILDHILRNLAYTSPTTVYVALSTAVINDDFAGLTEPSGNAYARVAVVFDAPAAGICDNQLVTFPQATPSGWGTITHFAIMDAITAGNGLYHDALTASKVVNALDTPRFQAGVLTVSEQ